MKTDLFDETAARRRLGEIEKRVDQLAMERKALAQERAELAEEERYIRRMLSAAEGRKRRVAQPSLAAVAGDE